MPSTARIRIAWLAVVLAACGGSTARDGLTDTARTVGATIDGGSPGDAVGPDPAQTDPRVLQPLLDAAFDRDGPTLPTLYFGVNLADISPDGTRVLTASPDVVSLWDGDTGQRIALLVHHPEEGDRRVFPRRTRTLRFSADGQLIARAFPVQLGNPAGIDLWDGRTGLPLRRMAGDFPEALGMAFTPDGARLVSVHTDGIRIWDVATGRRLPGPPAFRSPVRRVRVSPDGAAAWVEGDDDAGPRLRRTADGRVLVDGCPRSTGVVHHAFFSSDGDVAGCGRPDGAGGLWSARTGAELATERDGQMHCAVPGAHYTRLLPVPREAVVGPSTDAPPPDGPWVCLDSDLYLVDGRSGVALERSGRLDPYGPVEGRGLALGADRVVMAEPAGHGARLWTTRNRRPWRWVDLPAGDARRPLGSLAVSPDGARFAATLPEHRSEPAALVVWDLGGRVIARWALPALYSSTLRFSPDGTRVLDGKGNLFDIGRGAAIPLDDKPRYKRLRYTFAAQGQRVVAVGGRVHAWDSAGRKVLEADPDPLRPTPEWVAHAAGADLAVVANSRTVWTLDPITGKPIARIVEASVSCDVADVTAAGDRALVRCDSASRPWHVVSTADGAVVSVMPPEHTRGRDLAFSADGRFVLARGRETRVVDVATGVVRATLPSPSGVATLSPGGRWVAVGHESGHVELWRLPDGADEPPEKLAVPVFSAEVEDLRFTPDGGHLLIAGEALPRLVIMPFPLTRGALRAVACHNRQGWVTPGFDCEGR